MFAAAPFTSSIRCGSFSSESRKVGPTIATEWRTEKRPKTGDATALIPSSSSSSLKAYPFFLTNSSCARRSLGIDDRLRRISFE